MLSVCCPSEGELPWGRFPKRETIRVENNHKMTEPNVHVGGGTPVDRGMNRGHGLEEVQSNI